MFSLLRPSPFIRAFAKQILREQKPLPLVKLKMEENIQKCATTTTQTIEQLEKKLELRIREVEKKTDGLQEFLTKH